MAFSHNNTNSAATKLLSNWADVVAGKEIWMRLPGIVSNEISMMIGHIQALDDCDDVPSRISRRCDASTFDR